MSTSTTAGIEMPRYKCHKQVWALKIKSLDPLWVEVTDTREFAHNGMMITPEENGYAPFRVDQRYVEKHSPQVGGYFVQYDDGYKSFSPAKAFEDGYTRI